MSVAKTYKCGYSHCNHPDERITEGEGVIVGNRHYHKECFTEAETIKEIRGFYIENISETAVMSFLNKVINTIIYDKKVSAEYLLYCLKYAVSHKLRINSPAGLYYLIDNRRIKDAYAAEKITTVRKENKVTCDEDFDFNLPSQNAAPQIKRKSFADILRGDVN